MVEPLQATWSNPTSLGAGGGEQQGVNIFEQQPSLTHHLCLRKLGAVVKEVRRGDERPGLESRPQILPSERPRRGIFPKHLIHSRYKHQESTVCRNLMPDPEPGYCTNQPALLRAWTKLLGLAVSAPSPAKGTGNLARQEKLGEAGPGCGSGISLEVIPQRPEC